MRYFGLNRLGGARITEFEGQQNWGVSTLIAGAGWPDEYRVGTFRRSRAALVSQPLMLIRCEMLSVMLRQACRSRDRKEKDWSYPIEPSVAGVLTTRRMPAGEARAPDHLIVVAWIAIVWPMPPNSRNRVQTSSPSRQSFTG